MTTLLSIKHRTMNMSEYENFVHSIKPLPVDEAKVIEKLFSRLRHLFPALLVLDVIGMTFVTHLVMTNDLSTYVYVVLAFNFLMMCFPFYIAYRIYKRYTAFLLPYGLNVLDVTTGELSLNNYRKLSTVNNAEILKIIKQFVEYRNGALLDIDVKALKVDEYFRIESPHPKAVDFAEKRADLVKQILLKVDNANS